MKILHIFGAVVAVHLAVFLIIFAVPGCRTTGKSAKASPDADEGATPTGEASPLVSSSADAGGSTGTGLHDPIASSLNPPVAYASSAPVRYSPTRPSAGPAGVASAPGQLDVTPATTYTVLKGDSLWKIANKHGLTVAELAAANNLRPNASLQVGQKLVIIPKSSAPAGAARSSSSSSGSSNVSADGSPVHEVKSGESLSVIAKMYGTTTGTLKRLNNLRSDTVRVGQKLTLPDGVRASTGASAAQMSAAATNAGGGTFKHVVKPGETLSTIAKRYGVSRNELGVANNISDPSRLRAGQELLIPGWSAPKGDPAPATPSPAIKPAELSPFEPVTPAPEPTPRQDSQDGVPIIRVEDGPPVTPQGGTQEAPRIF